MNQEIRNTDTINKAIQSEATNAESMEALKEENSRLTEENASLSEKLKKTEYERKLYKEMWSNEDDKNKAMIEVIRELIKLAKLV